jgi:hypothetical protein
MAYVHLRSRVRRQPSGPVSLSANLPKPVFFVLPSVGLINLANNRLPLGTGGTPEAQRRAGPYGVAAYGAGANRSMYNGVATTRSDYTAIVVVRDFSDRSVNRSPIDADNVDSNRCFQLRFDAAACANFIPFDTVGATYSVTTENASLEFGPQLSTMAGRVWGTDASVFLNGRKHTSGAKTITGTPLGVVSGQYVSIGANSRASTPTQAFTGDIYAAMILDGAVSDPELIAITQDPWGRLLRPGHRTFFFTPGGGTTNATGDLTATDGADSADFAGTSVSARTATVTLVSESGTPQASLTNLKWAWFDEVTPDLFNAPTDQGAVESTDGSAVLIVELPNTTKTVGQIGWLIVTNSDGSTTQTPAHRAFSGPVAVT